MPLTLTQMKPILLVLIALLTINCSSSPRVVENGLEQSSATNQESLLNNPYVILVSIDGYRYDYTDLYSPPALKHFAEQGSSAQGLIPVYPSKTFTNHYSIATGLYAENHGIVANTFYDPTRKEQYKLSDPQKVQDGTWYGGEPLWVVAEKQGLLSASYFWPGSEANIGGIRPSYFYNYDQKTSLEARIEQVKKWLALSPERRPHFISLYFSDVDSAGHHFGPNSKEVRDAVHKVDHAISQLLKTVDEAKLPINVIIVSDHGMQTLDQQKVIYLDDSIDLNGVEIQGTGPQVMLYLNDKNQLETIYQKLSSNAQHYSVYKRDSVPARLHYSKNARIGDLVIIAEAPYSVGTHNALFSIEGGNHGYDPDVTRTMQGIFYARGPQIKDGIKLDSFRNVHIYPLILKILRLSAPQSDGDLKVLDSLYRTESVR